MSDNFWKKGLQFQCQPDCGACCSKEGDVFVTDEEMYELAKFLDMPIAQFRKKYTMRAYGKNRLHDQDSGACIFLNENMKCTVYEARPKQCRTYPFWTELLCSNISWEWEGLKCPGIGKGELIPAEDIKKRKDLYESDK